MIRSRVFLAALCGIGAFSALADDAKAPLTPSKPILIPGGAAGFDWMTFDSKQRRMYVAHKTAGLTVFDLDTSKVVATVPVGEAMGAAFDAVNDKIYVGTSAEQKVVVLDRKTLEKKGEIKVTGPCDDLTVCPANGMLYIDHDDGTDIWVVDTKTDKIVATITIPEAPEYLQYNKKANRIYQNIKSNNTVQVIDPATNKVEAVWKTDPATGPHGLAIDSKNQRLFTAGKNGKLVVIDMKSGKVVATVDIAAGVDQIAFDSSKGRVYCACAGKISVVQTTADSAVFLGDVPAPKGSHTLTIDTKTHSVWTSFTDGKASFLQEFKSE